MTQAARIVIVEDDFVIAQDLRLSLQALGYQILAVLASGEALLSFLEMELPDLVLMDINLEGALDGIETAQQLEKELQIPVIFLTALADEATLARAKSVNPQGYLVKPVSLPSLRASIELFVHRQQQPHAAPSAVQNTASLFLSDSFFVKNKNRLERVSLTDIYWIEAKDIYCLIKTEKAQYVVSHSLKTFEAQLPWEHFVRVHRSYIVSIDRVEAIEDNNLLIAQHYIPIGKTYREALQKRLRIF